VEPLLDPEAVVDVLLTEVYIKVRQVLFKQVIEHPHVLHQEGELHFIEAGQAVERDGLRRFLQELIEEPKRFLLLPSRHQEEEGGYEVHTLAVSKLRVIGRVSQEYVAEHGLANAPHFFVVEERMFGESPI